ncbi:hypothetical protein IQ255_29215 [Pleurocapsales cyanobacterium LEGE 10410]|nr:hypothetical protein [Pleurocapsales cyanobacterium LEGE 10410]
MNILSKLRIKSIAMAILMASFLFITTACNNGNEVGARPEVPPVQLGGQNNPHKAGGDGMTQYRSPANNPMLDKDNASLPTANLLAAANQSETAYPTDDNEVEGLLYSDSPAESLNNIDDVVSPQTQKALKDPAQIPAVKQPAIDRSNPDNKLLEKTGQMFNDAADFSAN